MDEPRFRRHADLRLTALEGEGVVLHLAERRYFSVNETGLTLLEALTQPRTIPQLVAALRGEYDVTEAAAEETTRAFIAQCMASSLLFEERG